MTKLEKGYDNTEMTDFVIGICTPIFKLHVRGCALLFFAEKTKGVVIPNLSDSGGVDYNSRTH